MWELPARVLLNAAAKQAGSGIAAKLFNDVANEPEAYADRIKRDFKLHDYADAWALYDSNRAYWEKYYSPPPSEPDWKNTFVRDSAAAAGAPGPNNVFEYGYPDSGPMQPSTGEMPPLRRSAIPSDSSIGRSQANGPLPSSAFVTGAPPIRYVSPASPAVAGFPGRLPEVDPADPSNPDWETRGGLPGLIREYMRNR